MRILVTPVLASIFIRSKLMSCCRDLMIFGSAPQVSSAAQTKGSESCAVPVSKRLRQKLARYAAQYPKHVLKPTAPLLFSAKGGGFSTQNVVNLFQRFYRFAAIVDLGTYELGGLTEVIRTSAEITIEIVDFDFFVASEYFDIPKNGWTTTGSVEVLTQAHSSCVTARD